MIKTTAPLSTNGWMMIAATNNFAINMVDITNPNGMFFDDQLFVDRHAARVDPAGVDNIYSRCLYPGRDTEDDRRDEFARSVVSGNWIDLSIIGVKE